ncbi:MAG: TlpA disulfide reductase family protein [Bacteroidota bacterium]
MRSQTKADSPIRGYFTVRNYEIPFRFRINRDPGKETITLFNARELVSYPLHLPTSETDSFRVHIEQYDAELVFKEDKDLDHNGLMRNYSGYYKRYNLSKPFTPIPFIAFENEVYKPFNQAVLISARQTYDLNIVSNSKTEHAVGNFSYMAKGFGSKTVSGTILTNSGDYRFMEGISEPVTKELGDTTHDERPLIVIGRKFYLSAFSGSSPVLLSLTSTSAAGDYKGVLVSPGGTDSVFAKINPHARLDDAYKITALKKESSALSFALQNPEGKTISINDSRYKNKPVIVTIMGTWCPNCVDEANFLGPWYLKNKDRGFEVIGLSFERKADTAFGNAAVRRMKKRFKTGYEILFAGQLGKDNVLKVLPELESFNGYPTTLFIGKDGKVKKIHTGYSGPATGKFYDEFQAEFKKETDALLNEKQ